MNFTKTGFYFLLILSMILGACGADPVDVADSGGNPNFGNGVHDAAPEDKLPQVRITTNQTIVDEPKTDGTMVIADYISEFYNGGIGIEIRGATSQSIFPKKSYGLETRDADNMDLDVALLDMPEEEDWILQGPYSDKTMIRNVLLYDFAREMGQYAARTRMVEVNINNNYKGVYVLMEKLKRDAHRIDINKLKVDENEGEDLTGGYIIKIDKAVGDNLGGGYNDQNSFISMFKEANNSSSNIRFLYDYPDAEVITDAQKLYIQTYFHDFETSLNSSSFTDPEEGYRKYIDVESFIDFFILNELSHNVDAYRLSTFMHKDKNGKLKMGPVWDFNLAFGNANYCLGGESNTWIYKFNETCPFDFWAVPFWWGRLLEDPVYVDQLKSRWNTLRNEALSQSAIFSKIDNYADQLKNSGAILDNEARWNVLGNEVWPNRFVGQNYDAEISYLKDWLSARLSWMDSNIDRL